MGYKLKEAREEAKLTQQQLAEKSGVSRVTIGAIENGTSKNVTLGTLRKLADALDKTINQIFFEENA